MGDGFEIVADVEVTQVGAPELADTIIGWLISRHIIDPTPTDCVLGAETGYPPGRHYAAAVTEPDDGIWERSTNGVEVRVGRNVFHPVSGDLGPVVCPRCQYSLVLEERSGTTAAWGPFSDALTAWHDGGAADVACPHCRVAVAFNDWQWIGHWPFAVGFLGFTFWNWPSLRLDFISQFADRLQHRVVITRGKL